MPCRRVVSCEEHLSIPETTIRIFRACRYTFSEIFTSGSPTNWPNKKKCCCEKNRVSRSEILFFKFYFQFKWIHCIWELSMNWTMTLFPVPIGPLHTCRTARIFALVATTKMCSIFLEQIRIFFLRGSIKFLASELKFRVGWVSGNTTIFFYGLFFHLYIICRIRECFLFDIRSVFNWRQSTYHREFLQSCLQAAFRKQRSNSNPFFRPNAVWCVSF
jgi:hypothetical protein